MTMDTMNKADFTEELAQKLEITKIEAKNFIETHNQLIADKLSQGNSIALAGFGTYIVSDRAARMGRNPQTGAEIAIPASKVARFKPSKALKDAVNNRA